MCRFLKWAHCNAKMQQNFKILIHDSDQVLHYDYEYIQKLNYKKIRFDAKS